MTERERKLGGGLALVAVLLGGFWGYGEFTDQLNKARLDATTAETKLRTAQLQLESAELYADEREWLENKEVFSEGSIFRKPAQIARTELLTFGKNQAVSAGLEVKAESLQPNDDSGTFFNRARVQFKVTGQEASFYRWLDQLNSPEDLRTITSLVVRPNRADDTLIDGTVMVELWYVPQDATAGTVGSDLPEPRSSLSDLDS